MRNFESLPYTSSPATNLAGTPASSAAVIICRANAGFVANSTVVGMPARCRRTGSSVQHLGSYRARSINACPRGAAYGLQLQQQVSRGVGERPTEPRDHLRCHGVVDDDAGRAGRDGAEGDGRLGGEFGAAVGGGQGDRQSFPDRGRGWCERDREEGGAGGECGGEGGVAAVVDVARKAPLRCAWTRDRVGLRGATDGPWLPGPRHSPTRPGGQWSRGGTALAVITLFSQWALSLGVRVWVR